MLYLGFVHPGLCQNLGFRFGPLAFRFSLRGLIVNVTAPEYGPHCPFDWVEFAVLCVRYVRCTVPDNKTPINEDFVSCVYTKQIRLNAQQMASKICRNRAG